MWSLLLFIQNTRKCGNYCCIATHSLTLANSLALACPPIGSHLFELAHSLTLACSLIGSHLLELTHFFLNPLAQCCQAIQFSLFSFICYIATKFCENTLIGVGDMTTKRNSKECPLVAEFSFHFQFLHVPVFQDLHMCHRAKFQQNRTIHDWTIAS